MAALPIADRAVPALRMAYPGRLIDRLALLQEHPFQAGMALARSTVSKPAMRKCRARAEKLMLRYRSAKSTVLPRRLFRPSSALAYGTLREDGMEY